MTWMPSVSGWASTGSARPAPICASSGPAPISPPIRAPYPTSRQLLSGGKVGPITLAAYDGRILNVHPALLPRHGGRGMYGLNVHRAVLEAGDTVSGASVHLVTAEYDEGPVIARQEVPVLSADTPESLAERVLSAEHSLLPTVIHDMATRDVFQGRHRGPGL